MSSVLQFHNEAMDLVEAAFAAKVRRESSLADDLLVRALDLERRAADLVRFDFSAEPTRSVLYRSAASLALQCKEFREAERLVAAGLAGNPPEEIAEELRDLLEQVHFERHLSLRGITLSPTELQLSMMGKGVGLGMTLNEEFVVRAQAIEKICLRTAERKAGEKFREKGRTRKALREQFGLLVAAPREGSFAVTFRIGVPQEQLSLPGLETPAQVIDEMLDCLELFETGNLEELRGRIADEAYYANFVGLVRQLAPDGDEVRQVGFTADRNGRERRVSLRERSLLPLATDVRRKQSQAKPVTIVGELRIANAVSRHIT
jgi:hypothetical protein